MKSRTKAVRSGRPKRAEASANALKDGDLTTVDPRAVLLTIAADTSAAATARVAACRALLAQAETAKKPGAKGDAVTELALKLLRGAK